MIEKARSPGPTIKPQRGGFLTLAEELPERKTQNTDTVVASPQNLLDQSLHWRSPSAHFELLKAWMKYQIRDCESNPAFALISLNARQSRSILLHTPSGSTLVSGFNIFHGPGCSYQHHPSRAPHRRSRSRTRHHAEYYIFHPRSASRGQGRRLRGTNPQSRAQKMTETSDHQQMHLLQDAGARQIRQRTA